MSAPISEHGATALMKHLESVMEEAFSGNNANLSPADILMRKLFVGRLVRESFKAGWEAAKSEVKP